MSEILFYGEANGKRLFQADSGFKDVDLGIALIAESNPIAPAGPGGESAFYSLVFVFLHTMAVSVVVTPIVDGVDLENQSILLTEKARRTRVQVELGLSIPILYQDVERGRCAPRGTWFSVRLAVAEITTGDLIVEGVAVEQEVVAESLVTQTFTRVQTISPPLANLTLTSFAPTIVVV